MILPIILNTGYHRNPDHVVSSLAQFDNLLWPVSLMVRAAVMVRKQVLNDLCHGCPNPLGFWIRLKKVKMKDNVGTSLLRMARVLVGQCFDI